MMTRLSLITLSLLGLLFPLSHEARTAVYWASAVSPQISVERGIRSKTVSLCFVDDAVSSRPGRVSQILTYVKEFEYVANVRFNYLGSCPPPTRQANGSDYYDGDIRVVIPGLSVSGTGPVPGNVCPMFRDMNGNYTGQNDGWGSWSNPPWDLPNNRACLYNLKLGDDPNPVGGSPAGDPPSTVPYLNHSLHEFAHALGLSHEHERNDVDRSACNAAGFGGGASNGFLTPYDRRSVMHYQFLTCGINGNYDNTGLSDLDRLALHILYPEDDLVAEFVGTTVVRTSATLSLQSAWRVRGANISFTARNFVWKISGTVVSTSPQLTTTFASPRTVTLQFTHGDFLGRNYSYTGTIRVLAPAVYSTVIAAPVAAHLPLL